MSSPTNVPVTALAERPIQKRRFRFLRLAVLFVILCMATLAIPPVFQFAVKHALSFVAWRNGATLTVKTVEGALWTPVRLVSTRVTRTGPTGSTMRLEIAQTDAEFAWQELLKRPIGRWFQKLKATGVRGKLDLIGETDRPAAGEKRDDDSRLPFPQRLEVSDLDLMVVTGSDYVRVLGSELTFSELETGNVVLDQVIVKQAWFQRTFRDVRGTSAIKGESVVIADLKLEPEVTIESISAKTEDLAEGVLNADVRIAAFGGSISGQARGLQQERQHGIEAGANFSQIGMAKLANFLGVTDAAGGTIKEGKFTFRGSPRNLPKASATLRLAATNFQWESRQWDSLVLGAMLLDKRVQIPEFELHQGHNHLTLNGEMALPAARTPWWQSEFSFNVSAKIENLTELSQLVLPEFQYAAGKVSIDGAVRGKSEQFNGALIVSGTDLTWRNTPIEELHAALKITGNELQVANFELLNNDDFVRGRGVVNILGAKQYWGELRASVDELGTYAELLKRPIVPEPLAGGGTINWTGEGSAKGHTGTFSARLQNLRTLGATGAFIHPLRANLEGTYSPGSIQFAQFSLSDESSAFRANVSVGNKALNLQQIKLTHGNETWLEGDAILPLDVWQSWPNIDVSTLLTDSVPAKINLLARQLQLREASRLTGWNWPVAGVIDGELKADGPIGKMETSGRLAFSEGLIPLPGNTSSLEQVAAEFSFSGQTLTVSSFTSKHHSGQYTASGSIDFTNVRDTSLKLAVASDAATVGAFKGIGLPVLSYSENGTAVPLVVTQIPVIAKLALQIEGPASGATVSGSVSPTRANLGGIPDLSRLWVDSTAAPLPPIYRTGGRPWSAWRFDLVIANESMPVEPLAGVSAAIDLRLTGFAGKPDLLGTIRITDEGRGDQASAPNVVSLGFRAGHPSHPAIDIVLNDRLLDSSVTAHITGLWSHPLRTFNAAPPLTPELAKALFEGRAPSIYPGGETAVALKAPAVLTGEAPVFDWAPIPDAPVPAPTEPASTQVTDSAAPVPSAPPAVPPSPAPDSTAQPNPAPAPIPPLQGAPAPASPISNQ